MQNAYSDVKLCEYAGICIYVSNIYNEYMPMRNCINRHEKKTFGGIYGMFNNLSGKLKVVGYLAFICGIIGTAAIVIVTEVFDESVLLGLLLIALGIFLSWLGSLIYFALAQILEDTQAIRYSVGGDSGVSHGVSQYARVVVPEAPAAAAVPATAAVYATAAVPATAAVSANAAAVPAETKISAKVFVKKALEFMYADGTLAYAKKNFEKMDDESKEMLAGITYFIANDEAENLRTALKEYKFN